MTSLGDGDYPETNATVTVLDIWNVAMTCRRCGATLTTSRPENAVRWHKRHTNGDACAQRQGMQPKEAAIH